MGSQRTISGTQFTLMMVTSYLVAGIFTYPSEVVREAGSAGLFSVLAATVLAFAFALLIVWVGSHFPGMTAVEWGDAIVPLFPLHRILASLGALFHTVMPPTIMREFTELLRETFFQTTPTWALLAALILVAAYGAYLGIEVIGRVTVMTLPIMLITVVIAYLLSAPMVEAYRMRPGLPDLPGLLRGTLHATLLYEGLAAIMLLQSKLEKPERAMRYVCYSFCISTVLFVLIYQTTLGAFGQQGIEALAWPAPQLLLLVKIRGWFTERLGLFVEIVWAGLLILNSAIHLWGVALAGVQVFGWKQRKAYVWVLLVEVAIYFTVGVIPPNIGAVERVFESLVWGFLYLNVGLPLVWLVVGLARGKFRRQHPQGHRA